MKKSIVFLPENGCVQTLWKFFVVLLLLSACAGPRRPPLSPGEDAFRRGIIGRLQAQQSQVRTLSGIARVVVATPKIRFAGNEVIHLKVPDRLHLETHDPLGGLQMLLVAQGEKGFIFYPAESIKGTFSPRNKNLERWFGIDLTVPELTRLLAGTPPLPPLTPESIRSEHDGDGLVVFFLNKGRVRQRVRMNGAGEVLRWERLDGRGTVDLTLLFEEFRAVDGVRVPFRILLQKKGETVLSIRYRSVLLNRPIDPGLFEVPPALPGGEKR